MEEKLTIEVADNGFARHKYISCPPYKRGVSVFIGTLADMRDWARQEFTNPEYADFIKELETCPYGEADTHFWQGCLIVRIPKFPESPEEIGILEHELLHAVFYIMEHSGVSFVGNDANEAFTYMLEWLTAKALDENGYEKVDKKIEL